MSLYSPLFQNKIPFLEALKQDIYLQYFHCSLFFPLQNNLWPIPYDIPLDIPYGGPPRDPLLL